MIDDKTAKKWKDKLLKKQKDAQQRITKADNLLTKEAFEKFFLDDSSPTITAVQEQQVTKEGQIWPLVYPKIALDVLDVPVFSENARIESVIFAKTNFPLKDLTVLPGITLNILDIVVEKDDFGVYPVIHTIPSWSGKSTRIERFLWHIGQYGRPEFRFKGSFLRDKTSLLITGIRLTGLVFEYSPSWDMTVHDLLTPMKFEEVKVL